MPMRPCPFRAGSLGRPAVVEHLQRQVPFAVPEPHRGRGGPARVAGHVGQGLLGDPVHRHVQACRYRQRVALDAQVDGETGGAHLVGQVAEPGDAGKRMECGTIAVVAQDTDEAAQLGQGRPTRLLDGRQRLPGVRPVGRQGEPLGPGLQDEQAQVVPDDVVQVAGDPRALVGGRVPGGLRAFPFQLGRQRGEFDGLVPPGADQAPDEPGGDAERAEHDEVPGLVDQERHERDGQPGDGHRAPGVGACRVDGDEDGQQG